MLPVKVANVGNHEKAIKDTKLVSEQVNTSHKRAKRAKKNKYTSKTKY